MKYFQFIDKNLVYIENDSKEGDVYDFDDINKAFANSLRELRDIYRLSGNSLANILGIPQQTLNLYEHNDRTPSFITAMQIASAFGLSIENMILNGLNLLEIDLEDISHYPTTKY